MNFPSSFDFVGEFLDGKNLLDSPKAWNRKAENSWISEADIPTIQDAILVKSGFF